MELSTIYDLMERFSASHLTCLELEQNGTRLKLSKEQPIAAAPLAAAVSVPSAAPVTAAPAESSADLEEISSPLVGTFYAAASPDDAPFVKVGDRVAKGQTICILEAMKAMTEIPAPMDCIIEEVVAENGSLVAFDAPLFKVRRV